LSDSLADVSLNHEFGIAPSPFAATGWGGGGALSIGRDCAQAAGML
jgi:hypothetical protein